MQKHLGYDGEICVIVVEECSPHLFLFCKKFRSCHDDAFLSDEHGLPCFPFYVSGCRQTYLLKVRWTKTFRILSSQTSGIVVRAFQCHRRLG